MLVAAFASGSAAVAAADPERLDPCITFTAEESDLRPEQLMAGVKDASVVIVDAPEPGACASSLHSPSPTLTQGPDGQAEPSTIPEVIQAGEYDACFLVTDAEMEGLFRRHLPEPSSGTRAGGAHDCMWSFDVDPMEMAVIWLGDYDGWASLAGLSADAIEGVGDEALWVLDGQLWVRSGNRAFTVMVLSDTLKAKDTAIAIARLAVPRIL